MSRYSVTHVEQVYQDVRRYCRERNIATLDEAELKRAVEGLPDWNLSAKEKRMLEVKSKYLGL